MKRLFGYGVLVALGLALVCFFAAPAVAFMGIRSAAQSQDNQGLQKLVDCDAVRVSLRPQLTQRPQAQTPPPSVLRDPYGAIMRQFQTAPVLINRGLEPDNYLSPAALDALIHGQGRDAMNATQALRPDKQKAPFTCPIYWSLNRARLAVPSKEGGRTVFTLERRGAYEWKLVHIGLPPEQATQPATRR